jgi:hypothetical protein
MVASPSPSPYYIHHRPNPSATQPPPPSAFPPPFDEYRNHHFDPAAPVSAGGFSFQMGPDPHIAEQQQQQPPPPHPAAAAASGGSPDELARKKRGRPRKYKPDGLAPSPPSQPSTALVVVPATPGPEKRKGRPPGSGKMQQLASLGKASPLCYPSLPRKKL